MQFIILTLFPEMFPGSLGYSIAKKAMHNKLWSYQTINIHDFALKNRQIDDTQYGGGASGLIIRYDVLYHALTYANKKFNIKKSFYTSPRGITFNQNIARNMSQQYNKETILILCGRFEGIDQRAIDEFNLQEISIGNFILSGGELACLTIMDALIRLIPGVVKKNENITCESFSNNNSSILYEHDLYTKPREFKGRKVPEILLSGNHHEISKWQQQNSLSKNNN